MPTGLAILTFVHVLLSLIGSRRCTRYADGEKAGWLDRGLSVNDGAHECDWILLPFPWIYTGHWGRHHLAHPAGRRGLRALRPPLGRRLAPHLRNYCRNFPLSQFLRTDRAAFPKGACT